jgi:hypothetical protein
MHPGKPQRKSSNISVWVTYRWIEIRCAEHTRPIPSNPKAIQDEQAASAMFDLCEA